MTEADRTNADSDTFEPAGTGTTGTGQEHQNPETEEDTASGGPA